jgi:predicted O-methyltransferase YrrM
MTITRTDLINHAIAKKGYKSYLEIGVQSGVNLKLVNAAEKLGVDPDKNSKADIFKTSDAFFAENKKTFDIIFIDGLHEANQCERDIENSLKVLNEGGMIICHDMNPSSEAMQKVPRIQKVWTGDVWKAFVKLKNKRNDLNMFVVDICTGCACISKSSDPIDHKTIKGNLTYKNLEKNRKVYLNLISYDEYKKLIPRNEI